MSELSRFDPRNDEVNTDNPGAEHLDVAEKPANWKTRIKNFGGAILDKVASINHKLSGAGYLEHIEQARVDGKAAQVRQLRESQKPADWEADEVPDNITYPPAVLGYDIVQQNEKDPTPVSVEEGSASAVTPTSARSRVGETARARLARRPRPPTAQSLDSASRAWLDESLMPARGGGVDTVIGSRARAPRYRLPGGRTATIQRVTSGTKQN